MVPLLYSSAVVIDLKYPLCPSRWEQQAFERSKLAFINSGQSVGKSLERSSSSKIMTAMLGQDMRFR